MPADTAQSIVTLRTDAEVFGLGFLVGKRHVATCAHVVNRALGRDPHSRERPGTHDTVRLEFSLLGNPPYDVRHARVVEWQPPSPSMDSPVTGSDIAVLEILREPAPIAAPIAKFGDPVRDAEVAVYGYPSDPPRPHVTRSSGRSGGIGGNGLVQIDDLPANALRTQPGYSGSPVIDKKTGKVVGMLAIASSRPDRRDCYAIPPEWLSAVLPPGGFWTRRTELLRTALSGLLKWVTRLGAPLIALLRKAWSARKKRVSLSALIPGLAGTAVVGLALAIAWANDVLPWQGAPPSHVGCIPLEVSVSTEKDELLADLARRYNASDRTFDHGRCAAVTVHGLSSGTAMESLAGGWTENPITGESLPDRPQVWMPTSSMWLGLLRERHRSNLLPQAPPPSVTSSVLGIAMPERMARALRSYYGGQVGWAEILKLATNDEGWGSLGHPEWGRFILGRDNPYYSTSGLAATVATYYAAISTTTRTAGKFTATDLNNGDVVKFVHGIESSVARYGDEATQFMQQLYDEDRKHPDPKRHVPFISAVVVQEQLAYLYNRGSPKGEVIQPPKGAGPHERMEMIYPNDGTFELDHPYVVLAYADHAQQAAAEDFRNFLDEDEQRQRFKDLGFRTREDPANPTQPLVDSVGATAGQHLSLIGAPPQNLIARMQAGWDANRKKAKVLLAIDVSGSMGDPVDPRRPEGQKKMDKFKPAALRGFRLLDDDDEVEVRTFSSGPDYRRQVPMSKVRESRQEVESVIRRLLPRGNTALYRTLLDAHAFMLDRLDSERINAIILLTDGKNFPENEQLRREVPKRVNAENLETSIRVFTISYGQDAERDLLRQIAEGSKASYYDATDPRDIDKVFVEVFSNFAG